MAVDTAVDQDLRLSRPQAVYRLNIDPGDPVLSWVAPDRTLTTTDLSVIVLPYCLPQICPTCYLDWHCSVDWCLAEPPK